MFNRGTRADEIESASRIVDEAVPMAHTVEEQRRILFVREPFDSLLDAPCTQRVPTSAPYRRDESSFGKVAADAVRRVEIVAICRDSTEIDTPARPKASRSPHIEVVSGGECADSEAVVDEDVYPVVASVPPRRLELTTVFCCKVEGIRIDEPEPLSDYIRACAYAPCERTRRFVCRNYSGGCIDTDKTGDECE